MTAFIVPVTESRYLHVSKVSSDKNYDSEHQDLEKLRHVLSSIENRHIMNSDFVLQ